MKRLLAILFAIVMLLSLAACGQDAPQSTTPGNAEQADSAPSTKEGTMEDGTTYTVYYNSALDGTGTRIEYHHPDGSYTEEIYNADKTLVSMTYKAADGTTGEMTFYANGATATDKTTHPDGSYEEYHFADDGYLDPETGYIVSGAPIYEKRVSADGQVEEFYYENNDEIKKEEDGSWWSESQFDDGTIVKTHYAKNGIPMEEIQENEQTGSRLEIKYYENGNEKSRDSYNAEHQYNLHIEYYESGSVMHSLFVEDSGYKREEKFNEAGYTTYWYDSNLDMAFFADDKGELLKYVNAGITYEGNAIPGDARSTFEQVRQVAAESTTTTQGEDGSSSTTTTYADGSVVTQGTTAEGCPFYESISANGDRYYEEYFATGTLKLFINKTADVYQEIHYDEDGYYIYFLFKAPGMEQEITCDETGKVDKVLMNGQVQTDIESIVKNMFFRSW